MTEIAKPQFPKSTSSLNRRLQDCPLARLAGGENCRRQGNLRDDAKSWQSNEDRFHSSVIRNLRIESSSSSSWQSEIPGLIGSPWMLLDGGPCRDRTLIGQLSFPRAIVGLGISGHCGCGCCTVAQADARR